MDDSSTTSPFFSYVFCIVAYFIAIFSNEISIMEYMHLLDISFTEYEQIIFFKLLGRITAAVILLLFVRVFSFKKIIVCNILLYFISVFNIIFIETSHEIMVLFFFLYTATTVVISTLLLGYILIDDKIDDNYSISVYAISLLVAYIIAETFEYFILSNSDAYYIPELMASNIVPIGVFLTMLFISPAYDHKIDLDNYRFFAVIKRMEMEILVGFTVFYIVMIVQNGYEVYALADSLTILTNTTREYLRLCSVILAIILTTAYVPKFNKHKVSIVCIVNLILLFVSMPQWGEYSISTIMAPSS